MTKTDSDLCVGAEDRGGSYQPWGWFENTPFPASQTFHPASPGFETSDEDAEQTTHHGPEMQTVLDPQLQHQRPSRDVPNSRHQAISQAHNDETGQRPSAASLSDSIGSHPLTELSQSEQLDEHGMPHNTSQTAVLSRQAFQPGIGSREKIARNDDPKSNHDSLDLATYHIQLFKKCLELDDDRHNWNELFALVEKNVKHPQMQPIPTASSLSREITKFYEERVPPTNLDPEFLNHNIIRKIIVDILKDQSIDSDDKITDIAEQVDALYGGVIWVLKQKHARGTDAGNSDSGFYDKSASFSTPISASQTLQSIEHRPFTSSAPQNKHLISTKDGDGNTKPSPKRRKTAKKPKLPPRLPRDNSESQPSPSRPQNSREILCHETGCNKSYLPSNMKRHYLSHYPIEVWICPRTTGEEPCTHWTCQFRV
ncbi:hypothetical protein B0J14DRAFT_651501 [Halenospora varia]|nr:hypothetical protein B0J14DRAFT_651501 [Halenospora varia]